MRRAFALFGLAAITAASLSLTAVPNGETQAAGNTGSTFMIPANDGYGVGQCPPGASNCGKVLADAWCEAQGFSRSLSFSMLDPEDVTGALATPASTQRPISITCAP